LIVMLAALTLVGCGNSENASKDSQEVENNTKSATKNQAESDYVSESENNSMEDSADTNNVETESETVEEVVSQPSLITKIINEDGQDEQDSIDSQEDKFIFEYNDVAFKAGDEAAPVIEQLGQADSQYEAPSCVFVGNDVVYVYDGFEVNTAKLDEKEVIVGIFITDDTIATPDGIKIGSNADEVIAVYGEPDQDEVGQMTWISDKVHLVIIAMNDEVTNISYIGQFGQ